MGDAKFSQPSDILPERALPVTFLHEVTLADVLNDIRNPGLPRDGEELRDEMEGEGFKYGGYVGGPPFATFTPHHYGARFVMPLAGFPDIEVVVHKYSDGYSVTMNSGHLSWWGPTRFYFNKHAFVDRRDGAIRQVNLMLEELKRTPFNY